MASAFVQIRDRKTQAIKQLVINTIGQGARYQATLSFAGLNTQF